MAKLQVGAGGPGQEAQTPHCNARAAERSPAQPCGRLHPARSPQALRVWRRGQETGRVQGRPRLAFPEDSPQEWSIQVRGALRATGGAQACAAAGLSSRDRDKVARKRDDSGWRNREKQGCIVDGAAAQAGAPAPSKGATGSRAHKWT